MSLYRISEFAAGKVSESVVSLKKEVVGFLSQHMAASNLANDEGITFCSLALQSRSSPPHEIPINSLMTATHLSFPVVAVDMLEEVVSDVDEVSKKDTRRQKRKR